MDKDRIEGVGKQAKGAVKEAFGKMTGDAKTQAEGAAEKTAGKAQNAVGGAKDGVREALKKEADPHGRSASCAPTSVDMGVRLLRPGLRSSRAGDRRPTVC